MSHSTYRASESSFDRIAIPSLWILLVLALLVVAVTIFREPHEGPTSDSSSRDSVPLRQLDWTPATSAPRL